MLEKLRSLLQYQVSIGNLIKLALIVGVPYLIVGVIWSFTHADHLEDMQGLDRLVSFLGSIVSWPVLLFSNVYMT
jgi:hypothetical protein